MKNRNLLALAGLGAILYLASRQSESAVVSRTPADVSRGFFTSNPISSFFDGIVQAITGDEGTSFGSSLFDLFNDDDDLAVSVDVTPPKEFRAASPSSSRAPVFVNDDSILPNIDLDAANEQPVTGDATPFVIDQGPVVDPTVADPVVIDTVVPETDLATVTPRTGRARRDTGLGVPRFLR